MRKNTGIIYQAYGTEKSQVSTANSVVAMSVEKTNFVEGEPIYVTYTNTAGKRVTKTYDVSLDEIEKTAELTDVKSNTTVEFMFYYESAYRQELTNVKATVQRVQQ